MLTEHFYKEQGIELNYYEIKNELQPLVLIHAQGVDATSFDNVWMQLSKTYHIYAVDCYGHGKRRHDPGQYNIIDISNAIIRFIEDVVQEKVFLLGHSSGGLISAYIASNTDLCKSLILEDPPFFLPRENGVKAVLTILTYLPFATILSISRTIRILFYTISAINTHGTFSQKNPERK